MWEVPKTEIDQIEVNPPPGGKPHPWEYAFKKADIAPLTPDQLTFRWDTMAARGLTDSKDGIIRLLDRDMFSSFITNFRL